MKNKKSENANLENKKGILYLLSLVVSLSLVLAAFGWKSQPKPVEIPQNHKNLPNEDTYIPPTIEKKQEAPKLKIVAQLIEIVGNDKNVNEMSDFLIPEVEDPFLNFSEYIPLRPEKNSDKEENIFVHVEQMPEFPGGHMALLKYLATSVQYPAIAQENGIMGKVYVSFVINEKGGIEDVTLARGVDTSLNNEALRVVRSLPAWKPGKQGGKAVKVRYSVPIVFELR